MSDTAMDIIRFMEELHEWRRIASSVNLGDIPFDPLLFAVWRIRDKQNREDLNVERESEDSTDMPEMQ